MRATTTLKCPECGDEFYVGPEREPIKYVDREQNCGPRPFLVIGGDWLLHRCVIDG